jgi:hypothetical protein
MSAALLIISCCVCTVLICFGSLPWSQIPAFPSTIRLSENDYLRDDVELHDICTLVIKTMMPASSWESTRAVSCCVELDGFLYQHVRAG